MFVYTLKASSIKFFAVILLSVAVLVTIVAVIPDFDAIGEVAAVSINYSGIDTEEERQAFLKQFGYELKEAPMDVVEVSIPEKFDSVYQTYNDIQRAQGLNLNKYQGKEVTRYTYEITNYEYDGTVLATIIVYKNKIIAGDICSADGEGFMHGFEKPL
ncbi:MAG: hypothetical protein A2Y15_08160 [Clostridiales bacterium GWF2_36_10]|nr:MAG: hypothetical protein A2Y15_08160 [Clostridiales bacterium GWF2_36_10]HAN21021.1 DUF4830 domain-containing protein [Clostridiales bacterium]